MINLQSGINVQQVSCFTPYTFLRLCTIPVISSKPTTFQHCCVLHLHTQRDLHRQLCFYTQRHLDVCGHNSVQKNLGFFRNLTLLSKSWFNLLFSFMPLVLGTESRTSYDNWKELTLKPIDFIRFGLYLTDQLEVYVPHYLITLGVQPQSSLLILTLSPRYSMRTVLNVKRKTTFAQLSRVSTQKIVVRRRFGSRTRTPLTGSGFSYHYSFRYPFGLMVWTISSPCNFLFRWLPYSLYAFPSYF